MIIVLMKGFYFLISTIYFYKTNLVLIDKLRRMKSLKTYALPQDIYLLCAIEQQAHVSYSMLGWFNIGQNFTCFFDITDKIKIRLVIFDVYDAFVDVSDQDSDNFICILGCLSQIHLSDCFFLPTNHGSDLSKAILISLEFIL